MTEKQANQTTRDQALRVARMLGCQGAHEHPNGWMPCASHEEYEAIKKGTEEYLKVRASKKKKPLPKMVQRTKRLETKSDAYYENRADAVAISKARGCGGVRTILLAGKKYYAVCNHKAPKRGWENLDEKPISGIATLPGGGLVTGSFSGKSLGRPIGGVAEFDGDGDGFSTGPDGEDNIPAMLKKPNKLLVRADAALSHLKEIEKKYSKKFGDLRDPQNMKKAMRSNFPNLIDDTELNDMYPARNADGSVKVRKIDVARVAMLLHASDGDPEIAKKLSVIGVSGKFAGGLFGGMYPGVFGIGVSRDPKRPFKAGIDFNPQQENYPQIRNHGWGFNLAGEMSDAGYPQEDINAVYFSYLAAHEFGHSKHLLRSLGKVGVDTDAKSEIEMLTNLKNMYTVSGKKPNYPPDASLENFIETLISGRLIIDEWSEDQNEEERRRISIVKLLQDEEFNFFRELQRKNNPAMWDSLTELEIEQISDNEEWQKVSNYAATNATEFIAEVISQGLMGITDAENPINWSKMSDWLNAKQEHKHDIRTITVSGVNPQIDGVTTVLCSGFQIASQGKGKPVEQKGFVNFVSRSTDPDTFSDPESARIRSRNLGCIGIRRYTARDGKLVWLPCTNVSDYNRVTGIRGDNSPRNNPRRQGAGFGKKDDQGSMVQTGLMSFKGVPKPKKKPPTVTSGDINDLAVRVRNNNSKAKTTAKTNLRDLKIVFLRGLEDGSKETAKKRVYKFLALLNSDKPADVKYFDDNDLLPLDHPWRNRKTNKKWAKFREGEYGVKYSKGCCPRVVKRHYSNTLIL